MSSSFNLAATLVAKLGNAFLVCERDGRLPAGEEHPLGLYLNDCRHLAVHELAIAGAAPRLLAGSDNAGTKLLHELTNPDLELPGGETLAPQSVRVRVERELVDERELVERIVVRSHARRAWRLPLELRLGADFRSVLELRGLTTTGSPGRVRARRARGGVGLRARAHDGTTLATEVRSDVEPDDIEIAGGGLAVLRFTLDLPPGAGTSISLSLTLRDEASPATAPRRASERHTTIHSDDQLFDRVLRRSLLDLRMLAS